VNFRDYLDTACSSITASPPDAAAMGAGGISSICSATRGARRSMPPRGRALERQRRSVEHLSRLGARQSGAERFRRGEHVLQRADCLEWVAAQETGGARFDLIFVDPPTFSNSKRMEECSTCSAITWDDPALAGPAAAGGPSGVLDQLHAIQARRAGACGFGRGRHQRPHDPKDFERNPTFTAAS